MQITASLAELGYWLVVAAEVKLGRRQVNLHGPDHGPGPLRF
jgi:hypothetical protein